MLLVSSSRFNKKKIRDNFAFLPHPPLHHNQPIDSPIIPLPERFNGERTKPFHQFISFQPFSHHKAAIFRFQQQTVESSLLDLVPFWFMGLHGPTHSFSFIRRPSSSLFEETIIILSFFITLLFMGPSRQNTMFLVWHYMLCRQQSDLCLYPRQFP